MTPTQEIAKQARELWRKIEPCDDNDSMCRDCADEDGVCPNTGLACDRFQLTIAALTVAREEGERKGRLAGIAEERARGGKAMDIIHRAAALLYDEALALAAKEKPKTD